LISSTIRKPIVNSKDRQSHLIEIPNGTQVYEIDGYEFEVVLAEESIKFNLEEFKKTTK